MSEAPGIDTARCPLCGGPNGCAMAADSDASRPCWCTAVRIDREVLARVLEPMRRKACICRACAEAQAPPAAAD